MNLQHITLRRRINAFAKLLRIETWLKDNAPAETRAMIQPAMREVTAAMVHYRRIGANTAINQLQKRPRRRVRDRSIEGRTVEHIRQHLVVERTVNLTEPQHQLRPSNWTFEQTDATPARFRKLLPRRVDAANLAVKAGIHMAAHLREASIKTERPWSVRDLSSDQIEFWRRRYGIPANRKNVMLCVARSSVQKKARPTREKTIGTSVPRKAAKDMLAYYGPLAGKMVRKLMRGAGDENNSYWKAVGQAVRSEKKKAA